MAQVTAPLATVIAHGAFEYGSPEWLKEAWNSAWKGSDPTAAGTEKA